LSSRPAPPTARRGRATVSGECHKPDPRRIHGSASRQRAARRLGTARAAGVAEPGALPNRASPGAAPAAAAEIAIELFDGASITAVFDHFDPNDSGVTWVGRVPALPGSQVTLVQGGGVLAASIILPNASYTIRPAPVDPGRSGARLRTSSCDDRDQQRRLPARGAAAHPCDRRNRAGGGQPTPRWRTRPTSSTC
jgi:hypothetical protein